MSTYTELPWNQIPGVGLFYGDRVPSDAAGLAYVHTTVPLPGDIINISDDLRDASKYIGNNLTGIVKVLEVQNGGLIDPTTGSSYVAPTDNVLLTTVTQQITSANGTLVNVPLFYSQELRYPLQISSLPPAIAQVFLGGIPLGADTFQLPSLSTLAAYVSITTPAGGPVPAGYLWNVMPSSISGDQLYITVYTNFRGSYNEKYLVSWNNYSETLNTVPVYRQNLQTASTRVYLASPVYNSFVSQQLQSVTGSGTSTATLTLSPTPPPYVPQIESLSSTGNPSITANPNYSNSTTSIAATNSNPYFTYDPSNLFVAYPTSPTSYTTAQSIAPQTAATALSLNLTLTTTSDANGSGALNVYLQDSDGNVLQNFSLVETSTTLQYYNPNAVAGIFTWVITPTADYTRASQNINGVPAGTYTYSVTFSGSYSWPTVISYSYVNNPGPVSVYGTPSSTIAPTSSYPLSFTIVDITTPSDANGATSYTVSLVQPLTNVVLQTWTNITSPQTLVYYNAGAVGGGYTWKLAPQVTNTGTSAESYQTFVDATMVYYVANTDQVSAYEITEGLPWNITTDASTIAPTSFSNQLSLLVTALTTPSSSAGASSLTVSLVDPYGITVGFWQGVELNQNLTYWAVGASPGTYIWNLQAYTTDNNIAVASFTVSATAIASWYDSTSSTNSLSLQTIGFNFGVMVPNGTMYLTTDDGPQIFVQEPHDLDNTSNWYLKIHRGWLNYTDPNNNNYLVGLQPYYTQNFNKNIPVISLQGERAKIIGPNRIRISNRPVLWNNNHLVDITVLRGGKSTVITRDNGMLNGNYVYEVLADCDSSRGEFETSTYIFLSSDVVTVAYSYLEYYYTYRGVVDIFNRFVHLDVNPTGTHTWMNLWNISDSETQNSVANSDVQSITSYIAPVTHQKERFKSIVPSGTATINAVPVTTPTVVQASAPTNFSESVSQVLTSTPTNVLETFNLNGNGVAVIQATPITNGGISAVTNSEQYIALATTQVIQVPQSVVNPNSNSAYNLLNCSILKTVNGNQDQRVTSAPISFSLTSNVASQAVPQTTGAFVHTWTPAANTVVAIQGTDVVPNSDSTAFEININGTNQTEHGGNGCTQSYPFNLYDNQNAVVIPETGVLGYNGPSCPPPLVYISISVTDSAGNLQYEQQIPVGSNGSTLLSMPSATLAGNYTISLSHTLNVNGYFQFLPEFWKWIDNLPLGNPAYVTSGTATISSIQSVAVYSYSSQNSPLNQYGTPSNTVAPLNSSTGLTFSLSSVVCTSDVNGQGCYNVTVSDPANRVVGQWLNITNNQVLTYWSDGAIAGPYIWSVYASVILPSNPTATGSYTCTANLNWSWFELDTIYINQYSPGYSTNGLSFATDLTTVAPTNSGNALTLTLTGTDIQYDSNGYSQLNINLYDPTNTIVASYVVNPTNTTTNFSYSNPNALAGTYVWSAQVEAQSAQNASSTETYAITTNFNFGWYDNTQVTNYIYSNIGGQKSYTTLINTLAPIDISSELSATFSYLDAPSDSYGSSTLNIVLLDPSGNTLINSPAVTGTNYIYHAAGAVSGQYVWQIQYNCTNNGTGSSSYTTSWSGQFSNKVKTIVKSYTLGTGTPITWKTGTGTLAPTTTGNQLDFSIPNLVAPSDTNGYGYLMLTLTDPNANVVSTWGPITAAGDYTYFNPSAINGQYTWTVTPYAYANNMGQSTYAISFTGRETWYKAVLINGISYVLTNGTTQNFTVSATTPPTSSYPLGLNIGGLQLTSDGINSSFFIVQLLDPSSNVLASWNSITSSQSLSWSGSGAVAGTYTWQVTASAFNANTQAGTYTASMNAQQTYYQNYNVPTVFYVAPTFNTFSYQTGPFTTTPTTEESQVSFELDSFNYPKSSHYSMQILVSVIDPNGTTQQQFLLPGPTTVTWYSPTAAAGNYTWTLQPQITINNNGTATIPVSWSGKVGFYAPVDDETPTVKLTQKVIYMYLTATGWPFHAVLDPEDDPTQPLSYDTNNALLNTIYTAVPTIHAY